MQTDSTKLKQILLNLIGNACKFCEKGTISLSAVSLQKNEDDYIQFKIKDTGIGMNADDVKLIFEKFTQADITTSKKYGGTGLGLSIVYKLVELLNGEITVDSRLKEGTEFTITFPRVLGNLPIEKPMVLIPATDMPTKRILKSNKVLIIEDDETTRDICKNYLEKAGYDVLLAANGSEGLKLAREHHPAVVVLDVLLPELNGWDVLTLLKSTKETSDIIVFVVSILDEKNKGFALGANDYLVKPISRLQLTNTLNRYLKKQGKANILIIDDDESSRIQINQMLKKEKYQTMEATNGVEGLSILSKHTIDIIILDLMMPVMDGFEFLEKLRLTDHWSHIPVIVLTSKSLSSEETKKLSGRVAQKLQKGQFDSKALYNALHATMKQFTYEK